MHSVFLVKSGVTEKRADGANGVNSSPSVEVTLGEGFPECAIFSTRGRPLSRERHPRKLFPECFFAFPVSPVVFPPDMSMIDHNVVSSSKNMFMLAFWQI
jgi:hypothetical protein